MHTQTCDEYVDDSQTESGFASGGINIYDIYADVCSPERATLEARQFARVLGAKKAAVTEGAPSSQHGTAVPFETMSLAATVSLLEPGDSIRFPRYFGLLHKRISLNINI